MISKYIAILPLVSIALAPQALAAAEAEADSVKSEKVHVAFATRDADELLGGVSVLNMADMSKKNYINAVQTGYEAYVSGWNGNSLWGQDSDNDGGYLVLIDGVPRDDNNISSSEIEQITFLKGAQAVVLYGSRAAKGAILITTKRGQQGPLSLTVRANTGWNVAKEFPEYLGAAEYMTLYNEARLNDGLSALYSDKEIYNTYSGVNPYRYPDVNFYSKDYLKKAYNYSDATLEITGGSERARFYSNINYMRYGDFLNFGDAKDNYTDRLSVRGNIDLNLAKWASAYIDASATFYNSRRAHGDFWSEAASMRPNRIAPLIPLSLISADATDVLAQVMASPNLVNGCFLAGTQQDKTNVFADIYATGYNKFTSRQFQFDAGLNLDLSGITKGLSFNSQFAIDYATSYDSGFTDKYSVFVPVWGSANGKEEIVGVTQEGKDEHSGSQYVSNSANRQTIHLTAQFDYDRTFAGVHNIHAIALANGWQRTYAGQYHRKNNVNLGFQLSYNFDHRYYLDAAASLIHSSKLAPGHRKAWSPSATLGWRISQEGFLKDNTTVNELMLSVSASNLKTDLDIDGFYLYEENFNSGDWFSWGGGSPVSYIQRGSNVGLDYVKRKEVSANLRGQLFSGAVEFDFSGFITKTEGLLVNSLSTYPLYFQLYRPENANFAPWANFNDNKRTGFDYNVRFHKTAGEVNLTLGLTGTYYTTKATKRDEKNEFAYQNRQGQILDGIWGYRCEGFFTSQEEISGWADQSPLGGTNIQPGEIGRAHV